MADKKKGKPLDDRQLAYCREYIVDFNQTKSAIRAGYSERSARQTASRLMTNDNILEEIRRLVNERANRTEITADRVIREFAKIAFSNIKDVATWNKAGAYVTLKRMEEVDGALIAEIGNTENGVKIKLHDKMKALEALAKHTGVYDERPTSSVDVNLFVKALWDRTEAGDVWDGFDNDGPGDDNGED